MKYLLVLAVILIGFWAWRSGREARKPPSQRRAPDSTKALEMVPCDVCGVHCPKGDLVVGKRGVYCGAQHRSQAEA